MLQLLRILEQQDANQSLFDSRAIGMLRGISEYHELLEKVRQKVDSPEKVVLLVLRALAKQKAELRPKLIEADLVATFPGTMLVSARHTGQVIREMIAGARREIIVAGYAITDEGTLPELLASASPMVDRIIVLCSNWKGSDGRTARKLLVENWPAPRKPEVFEYDNEAGSGLMHVKCLICDSADLLISSANFTHSGINRNFEFGTRLRGAIAASARAVFGEFLASGRFQKVAG